MKCSRRRLFRAFSLFAISENSLCNRFDAFHTNVGPADRTKEPIHIHSPPVSDALAPPAYFLQFLVESRARVDIDEVLSGDMFRGDNDGSS